ncbi:MAG: phosphoribosylformimino-5-aminoimidazole carboxamide ribotide isomerase [Verrucomicrobiota bacterium]
MTLFRPCIDLHNGQVKQIVGSSLTDNASELRTNFVSERPSSYFARRYREDGLTGGHVIQLGAGNLGAASEALRAYPQGLQIGGGIRIDNADEFLQLGASHIIVTSWLFDQRGRFDRGRLKELASHVGPDRLVIDLSCRKTEEGWTVAMNRWQTLTDLRINYTSLDRLADACSEFLIHAADVEGKCQGIDEGLVEYLGKWAQRPVTYAGGAYQFSDLERVENLSAGNVDLTIGSALDIFGGSQIKYAECVDWNHRKGRLD